MATLKLPVVENISDGVHFSDTETVDIPEQLCIDILSIAPKSFISRVLPPNMQIKGFRSATTAPIRIIFDHIKSIDQGPLPVMLTGICMEVTNQIHGKSRKQIKSGLVELVTKHGEAKVRYTLLTDKRKTVQSLAERLNPTLSQETITSESVANTNLDETIGQPKLLLQHETIDLKAYKTIQKRLAKAEKALCERDAEIQKLRQDKGNRDHTLGQLRQELMTRNIEIEKLQKDLEAAKAKSYETKLLQQQAGNLAIMESQLEKRERTLASIFGTGAAKLKAQLVDNVIRIHDLESRLTSLNILLQEQARQRDAAVDALNGYTHIPFTRCIDVVRAHIEAEIGRKSDQISTTCEALSERLALAEQIKEHLRTIMSLENIPNKESQVAVTDLIGNVLTEFGQTVCQADAVKVTLQGPVHYEGPHAWLVTDQHVVGIPSTITEEEQLMSGDTVAITLFHDRNSLVDVETDVITRNESQVVNDALREDDEGLYLLSQNGRRLSVSQSEFIRAGVEVGSPVQVIAPVWLPIDGQSDLITTFCRIIKRLEDTPLRLRTSVGSVEKRHGQHDEAPALELVPLFAGQTILVVGGDGLQTGFQAVIQSMGGNFDWQSGFGQLSRIPDRVRSADVVVIVTGSVYHAASGLAINEARRTNTPIHYLNTLGRASFIRFLSEIAASREYTVTSTVQSSNMTNECMASSVSS